MVSAHAFGCVDFFELSPVIPREARDLKSVNGVCAASLDSSLRCAAFRMTGGEGAGFGMTE